MAILQEQERMRYMSVIGDDIIIADQALCKVYQEAGTVHCQTMALVQGLKDEQDIRDYCVAVHANIYYSDDDSSLDWSGHILEDVELGGDSQSSGMDQQHASLAAANQSQQQPLVCRLAA
jgi:hypothetical protein